MRASNTLTALFMCATLTTLFGCSEGGTAGTGGITAPPASQATPSLITGKANKGPMTNGTLINIAQLSNAGIVQERETGSKVTTDAGDYSFGTSNQGIYLIDISGQYLSEISGNIEASIKLSMVVNLDNSSEQHNVNLLTTLAAPRIRALLGDGVVIDQAITMAESELQLALSNLVTGFTNSEGFSDLVIINELSTDASPRGTAYLLTLSSIFDQLAHKRTANNNLSVAENLQFVLNQIASDLAVNGALSNQQFLTELQLARSEIKPGEIYLNLFRGIDSLSSAALEKLTNASSDATSCTQNQNDVICPANTQGSIQISISATNLIADMDLFLDTDGDGQVNTDDNDDDNDGILDDDDATPYGP